MNRGFPLANLEVIGPFNLVGLYDEDGRFTQACCSCGWKWDGFPDQMREACEFHNATHKNILKIQNLYESLVLTYEETISFLVMVSDLNEGKACELISLWTLNGLQKYAVQP